MAVLLLMLTALLPAALLRPQQGYCNYPPVMSPSSLDAWKMDGFSNTNIACPDVPVLARLRETSGAVGSSTPRMNCIVAASHTCSGRLISCTRGPATCLLENGLTPASKGHNHVANTAEAVDDHCFVVPVAKPHLPAACA